MLDKTYFLTVDVLSLFFNLELLEDAVEEMSEDLALPIAIVLIVGFLGNNFHFNFNILSIFS